jgi:hypothetical protein
VTRAEPPPPEIVDLARERAAARAARDFARADALRAEIEAAGWKVVDGGTAFRLEPAAPPTVEADGLVRYGAASAVPSVLDERPTARFTVELLAEDWPDDLARMLAGLRAHAPAGTQVVVVANRPSAAQAAGLTPGHPDVEPIAGTAPEVVWTSERLGHAAARNVGLRRAVGSIVVLADTSVEPTGDPLSLLEPALADPGIAVAGGFGLVSADLRRLEDAPGSEVDVVQLCWLAFRRADFVALGPLDERFAFDRYLDTWWSLVLRAGLDPDAPPRGARRLDLPLARHEERGPTSLRGADRDRLSKRNFYRVLDRFRDRRDLLSGRFGGSADAAVNEPGPRPAG